MAQRLFLPAVACCVALTSACTSATGDGDGVPESPEIVDLDSKADTALQFDLETMPMFRLVCDLDRCRYHLTLEVDVMWTDVNIVTGTLDELLALRDDMRAGKAPAPMTTELRTITPEDTSGGVVSAYLNIGRGLRYGMLFSTSRGLSPSIAARLRVVPGFDSAIPLPQVTTGSYFVQSTVDDETHAWSVPVTDVFGLSSPTIQVELEGDQMHLDLATYYQCSSDGTTYDGGESFLQKFQQIDTFEADCPTSDDGGRVYIEVTGSQAYELTVTF